MDEELTQIALTQATDAVDEEVAHHPDLLPHREMLLKNKLNTVEKELRNKNDNLNVELKEAFALIKNHISLLPPDQSKSLFDKLIKSKSSNTIDLEKTVQENLGLPDEYLHVMYNLALDLQNKGEHANALRVIKYLIVLNPYVTDFVVALGFNQLCLNLTEQAIKSFQLALSHDPSNFLGHYFLAYTHHLLKNGVAALDQINQALEHSGSPHFSEWETTFKEIQEYLSSNKEKV